MCLKEMFLTRGSVDVHVDQTLQPAGLQCGQAGQVACCHANFKASCRQMEGKCHAVPAWSQSLLPAAQSVEDVLELEGVLKPHVDFSVLK